jgi:hypothetical protein
MLASANLPLPSREHVETSGYCVKHRDGASRCVVGNVCYRTARFTSCGGTDSSQGSCKEVTRARQTYDERINLGRCIFRFPRGYVGLDGDHFPVKDIRIHRERSTATIYFECVSVTVFIKQTNSFRCVERVSAL